MRKLEDEFGDIIQKARQGKELSVEKLSYQTNIDSDRIRGFEGYTIAPQKNELDILAQKLNLSLQKLTASAQKTWYTDEIPDSLHVLEPVEGIGNEYFRFLRSPENRSNCYMLWDKKKNELLIVDPGWGAEKILNIIDIWYKNSSTLKNDREETVKTVVLITHSHSDHLGALASISERLEGEIIMHRDENYSVNFSTSLQLKTVSKDRNLIWAGREISIFHTPGHTPGSITFKLDRAMFTGDALFAGSIGRTGYGSRGYNDLKKSVREKILTQSESNLIYPGHAAFTTVKDEKKQNPFF